MRGDLLIIVGMSALIFMALGVLAWEVMVAWDEWRENQQ